MKTWEISDMRLNEVIEAICDDYCKWPDECSNQEELTEKCNDCPLNNILNKEEDAK